jgi:carbohydrate-selective porin OprB
MTLAEGATTLYLAFDGAWPLAKGLNINTRLMAGTTRMQEGGPSIFANPSNVITSALHIGLNVQDLLAKGDRIGLSLAQPLRVEAGHIGAEIANHWDYETEQTSFATSRMSLVPSGRETDIELSYKTALTEHLRLQANLLHQIQPGHDANADPQTSLVIQTKVEF